MLAQAKPHPRFVLPIVGPTGWQPCGPPYPTRALLHSALVIGAIGRLVAARPFGMSGHSRPCHRLASRSGTRIAGRPSRSQRRSGCRWRHRLTCCSTPMAAPAVFEPLERVVCRPLSGRPTPPARRVKRQAVSSPIHSHAAYWCEFESTAVIAFDLAINEYGLLRAPTGPGQLPTVRASIERQSAGRGTPNNIGACWVK